MTQTLCPACTAGPSQIDGHSRLFTWTLGGGLFSLRCQDCNALWKRTTVDGKYLWERIGEPSARNGEMGVLVPPRSNGSTEARATLRPTLTR